MGTHQESQGRRSASAEMDAARKEGKVIIKDAIADITLQQVLTRPEEFHVIATLNSMATICPTRLRRKSVGSALHPAVM